MTNIWTSLGDRPGFSTARTPAGAFLALKEPFKLVTKDPTRGSWLEEALVGTAIENYLLDLGEAHARQFAQQRPDLYRVYGRDWRSKIDGNARITVYGLHHAGFEVTFPADITTALTQLNMLYHQAEKQPYVGRMEFDLEYILFKTYEYGLIETLESIYEDAVETVG